MVWSYIHKSPDLDIFLLCVFFLVSECNDIACLAFAGFNSRQKKAFRNIFVLRLLRMDCCVLYETKNSSQSKLPSGLYL